MRIPKGWITPLSKEIVEALCKKNLIELNISKEKFIETVYELVLDELMVEDRLNNEVRELLKKYDAEIEKNRLDYRKLFEITKQKLVRERNLVL
jgi:hypothetical protein